MKVLVCGLGSIGERHVSNCLSLGYEDIIVYRNRNLPLRSLDRDFEVFLDLGEALREKPDVALICNPTHLHLDTTRSCLKAGCHVLVEKPLSHTLEGLEELEIVSEKHSRLLMVGYMMRFHPCLQKIKEWLDTDQIGELVYLRSQWGEYLPDWHPWEDYRLTYAALKEMGGGPGLTLSHELDTALWLGGHYSSAVAMTNRASSLEVNTEHAVDLLIRFESGATANVHMDYFQSPPSRSLEVVGRNGRIVFEYYKSTVTLYKRGSNMAECVYDISSSFDRNDLFVSELKYFFASINHGKPVTPGVREGVQVVRLLENALRSEI